MVCNFRTLNAEQYQVQLTIGGDKLNHSDKTASPTANWIDTKIPVNSTISDVHKEHES